MLTTAIVALFRPFSMIGQSLAVELLPLKNFYSAEEYHQDYLVKNPDGYCHLPFALFEYAKQANAIIE